MPIRQAAATGGNSPSDEGGRVAQRRRTRAAIIAATSRLISAGHTPSVDEIAAAADVSRRTVYMYFPTLDQLLLDATVGALSAATLEETLTPKGNPEDPIERVDALVRTLTRTASTTLPLGRKIIALTVDAPDTGEGSADPRRGYRRMAWIRRAVEPLRTTLTAEQFERLVAGLSVIVGWEAMVVLRDVGGLRPKREEEVMRWAARALVDAIVAEGPPPGRKPAR